MKARLYQDFIHRIIDFGQRSKYPSTFIISQYLRMNDQPKIAQINQLKAWLDQFRPLEPMMVAELKKLYDVRLTYNSNAIEGNTLTQSETESC